MRYIALIALIDFLLLTAFGAATGDPLTNSAGFALVTCFIGVPCGLVLGIPLLWISRRLAPGNLSLLAIMGALAGALIPIAFTWGIWLTPIIAVGAFLGFVSAALWWGLVERGPDRHTKYE